MGLFGGGGAETTSSNKPYDAQRHKLEYGWNEAKANYQQGSGVGPYQGPTYAGLNGQQTGAIDRYQAYLNGPQTGQVQGAIDASALAGLNGGMGYGSNAQGIFNQYGGPATNGIQSRVNAYMADPALQGSIDAAKTDVYRDLNERQLPGIGLNAEAGGNVNSSRAGVAQGIAMRGAGETAANIDANMRSQAYSQALGAAQNDYFGGANTSLAANAQVGQAGQQGANLAAGGLGYGSGVYQGALGAGSVTQGDQQNQLNDQFGRYGYQNGGYQNGLLNNYLGQVGGAQWGSQAQQKQAGPGAIQGIAGGALAGASVGGPWGAAIGGGLGLLASL